MREYNPVQLQLPNDGSTAGESYREQLGSLMYIMLCVEWFVDCALERSKTSSALSKWYKVVWPSLSEGQAQTLVGYVDTDWADEAGRSNPPRR